MRRSIVVVAVLGVGAATAGLAAPGCSDAEGAAPTGTPDLLDAQLGGLDAPLGAPQPDADPPPGDVCGPRAGLESSSTWPLAGGCPTRAGRTALTGPLTSGIWWSTPLATGESSPAVAGTRPVLWIGTSTGDILAFDGGGKLVAGHVTGAPVRSSPAVRADGTVIVGGGDGVLYGLDVPSGSVAPGDAGFPPAKVVFALPLGSVASSPVIGEGAIYVGTVDGRLLAIAPDGSSIRFSVPTHDTHGSSPALGQDGTVYVGSSDGHLYAIAPNGDTKWSVDVGAEIDASPAVGGDGTVYIGSLDGALHAIDASGKARFRYVTGGPITRTPAVYAGTVYVGSADKKLHAVSTVDGTPRFTYATLGAVATPLIGQDGTIYAGSEDQHVYAITPKGTLLFSVNVKGRVRGAPAIYAGPVLLVVTDKGLVATGP